MNITIDNSEHCILPGSTLPEGPDDKITDPDPPTTY